VSLTVDEVACWAGEPLILFIGDVLTRFARAAAPHRPTRRADIPPLLR
jgi:hypothetical protein